MLLFCRSLLPSSPFLSLIGRDFLTTNHRAKQILTHKLLLVRTPSSPRHALHNLLGCVAASHNSLHLLRKSVGAALGVWSDSTSIRHMDGRQHLWISQVVVLGVVLLEEYGELEQDKSGEESFVFFPLAYVGSLWLVYAMKYRGDYPYAQTINFSMYTMEMYGDM